MRRRDAGAEELFKRSEAEWTRLGWRSNPAALNRLTSLAAHVLAKHGELTSAKEAHVRACADGSVPDPRPQRDNAQRIVREYLSGSDPSGA